MRKSSLKSGLCFGLILTLMLSAASCGKNDKSEDEYAVDDYVVESTTASDDVPNNTESGSENIQHDGRSLTEIFGDTISENDSFTIGGVNANYKLNYKVPEADHINVYECSFVADDADTEKQIVNNFFGGTEKNLDEIKYVNEYDYMMLLYKYRSILMTQALDDSGAGISEDEYDQFMSNIGSSFEEVYTWAEEDSYYIHMYEGDYNGNRYGMIYYYDKVSKARNIFVCPISMAEYFPDATAKTMFIEDETFNSGAANLCNKSEADILNDAGDIVESLGINKKDIVLNFNPNMAIPEVGLLSIYGGWEGPFTEMPRVVFSDSDMNDSVIHMNMVNPSGRTYGYKILTEQAPMQNVRKNTDDASFTENGYAVYLTSEPFAENVNPQNPSTFNRGSILFTDRGLYLVDISLVAEIDNVVEDVQLLSFDNIKESLKEAMGNDSKIVQKSSGNLEISSVDFTYVLINDEANKDKATYVPAWYFVTKDKKLKSGEQPITYSHIINAIDGMELKDTVR